MRALCRQCDAVCPPEGESVAGPPILSHGGRRFVTAACRSSRSNLQQHAGVRRRKLLLVFTFDSVGLPGGKILTDSLRLTLVGHRSQLSCRSCLSLILTTERMKDKVKPPSVISRLQDRKQKGRKLKNKTTKDGGKRYSPSPRHR